MDGGRRAGRRSPDRGGDPAVRGRTPTRRRGGCRRTASRGGTCGTATNARSPADSSRTTRASPRRRRDYRKKGRTRCERPRGGARPRDGGRSGRRLPTPPTRDGGWNDNRCRCASEEYLEERDASRGRERHDRSGDEVAEKDVRQRLFERDVEEI